ncbi:hypothetical protein [Nocardia vulneris]|uniref:Uncharacterized protein n=1 Tax=Nocardia vulneris TaxID=1141657 RepID=A0ABR4ZCI6_9NOCA|nr:hypothetical protein [Nocardia vulneris]KIA63030.1 hypothetical protein FG87_21950 [Nocardia vulneris]
MTLSRNETDTAALKVVREKLDRGVSHVEVELILNGPPGAREWSVEELRQVRDRVHELFAEYLAAITPERVA